MSHLVCHTAPRFALCAIAVLTIASARAEEAAATRAASINETCVTLGKGTEKLASKTHAPPAADIARDPPGDGCAEALANPEVLKLVRRALAEEEAGQLREAIETGKQALRLYPRNECQLNTIAGLYGKLREPEQEVTWARKALEVRPTFALAYVNLGNAYAAMNQGSQSTNAFERAAALDPKSPLPLYGLGALSEQQGRAQEALELYRKSVAVAPSFEDGYFNLAAAAANLKRFDEARAALERVLQLNPKAEDARAMLRRIDGAARR